jgi:translation elongation factor EF-Ts
MLFIISMEVLPFYMNIHFIYFKAEAWMREEAQKAGWAKAGKLGDRPMSQGLVGMIQDDSSVTIVEVYID